jgi:hypothetical protein
MAKRREGFIRYTKDRLASELQAAPSKRSEVLGRARGIDPGLRLDQVTEGLEMLRTKRGDPQRIAVEIATA